VKPEHYVDVVNFNARTMITIAEPGIPRLKNGEAVNKIQMSVQEAVDLWRELGETLDKFFIPEHIRKEVQKEIQKEVQKEIQKEVQKEIQKDVD
jgi:hypothetical protein